MGIGVNTRAPISPSQHVRELQQELETLKAKRLSALRLYQDEKTLRQRETARADQMAIQLSQVKQPHSSPPPPRARLLDRNKLHTDHFSAELRTISLTPTQATISLTWHCLAMADLIKSPTNVLAVLEPTAPMPNNHALLEDAAPNQIKHLDSTYPSPSADSTHTTVSKIDQLRSLSEKLHNKPSQNSSYLSSSSATETFIADLNSKLDLSVSTCMDLLATVRKQQDTIQRLSRSR